MARIQMDTYVESVLDGSYSPASYTVTITLRGFLTEEGAESIRREITHMMLDRYPPKIEYPKLVSAGLLGAKQIGREQLTRRKSRDR